MRGSAFYLGVTAGSDPVECLIAAWGRQHGRQKGKWGVVDEGMQQVIVATRHRGRVGRSRYCAEAQCKWTYIDDNVRGGGGATVDDPRFEGAAFYSVQYGPAGRRRRELSSEVRSQLTTLRKRLQITDHGYRDSLGVMCISQTGPRDVRCWLGHGAAASEAGCSKPSAEA